MNSPNAQAYNQTIATIIRIGTTEEKDDVILRILAEESPDSELRLKRLYIKEVWVAKLDFWKDLGHFCKD
jgi:hypothetical protein